MGDPREAVTYESLPDGLSVQEFRTFGRSSPPVVDTRLGRLEFSEGGFAGGYPLPETTVRLFDEMDFQRATQAYLWASPLVSYAQWLRAHEEVFGAEDCQFVYYPSAASKQGILTANATTPYFIAWADLTRTGPIALDIPAGPSAGIVNDMWQRAVWDFGVSGPDGGAGTRLVIVAPGMTPPSDVDPESETIIENGTNIVFLGVRALQPNPAEAEALLRRFRAYPYAERAHPAAVPVIEVGDDTAWGQWQPHGLAFWEVLKDILDREVIEERDRFMLAMLDSLGLGKGVPFEPDDRQRRLLKEAAVVGEAMAKASAFTPGRFPNTSVYENTHWDQLMVVGYDDRGEHFDQLYRRAAFTWEAVTRGRAYYIERPGIGQQYRTAYCDADGAPLVGSGHYVLRIPSSPPVETFWSIVVYDVNTRTLLLNDEARPMVSSRSGVGEDADGSVTIHIAPEQPDGVPSSNWLQTNRGESWFAYLRFYGPTLEYFEQSWPLRDIDRIP